MPLHIPMAVTVSRLGLIEEQILVADAGRVTFTDLDLNTYKTYKLIAEWQNPLEYMNYIFLLYNGDEVASNYRSQYIRSADVSTTESRFNRPDIAWSESCVPPSRACNMAEITIGISPTGFITALCISKTEQTSGIEVLNHVQTHLVSQANLTQLVLSARRHTTFVEVDGFVAGSKFRLYGYKEE